MTKWNLKLFFKNVSDPNIQKVLNEAEIETKKFVKKWELRTDYLEIPKVLKKALDEYEYWNRNFGICGNVPVYFNLKSLLDQANPKYKAKLNELSDRSIKLYNSIQFFDMRISKIPKNKQKQFLEYPALKDYKHYLKRSFEVAEHVLSEPEERILNFKKKTSFGNWVNMVEEFFSKEEMEVDGKTRSFSEAFGFLDNPNKKIRDEAASSLNKIFEKHLDVVEKEINTVCENKKVNDTIRGYKRPDTARHLSDDIDTEVADILVETVTDKFSLSKEFYKFKIKLLGLKRLEYHEKSLSYGCSRKEYSFKSAVELVGRSFGNLDQKFLDIFNEYLDNGHIDAFPKKGKVGGAACYGGYSRNPTFIWLNYNRSLSDVLALAHEVGHGINLELMKPVRNELSFGTPTSTAEVASTFFENCVFNELSKGITDEERLILYMQKLDRDVATIFRQIAFYNFEVELHKEFREKNYLTKYQIGALFEKHMKTYLGSAAEGSKNWWVYIGHFRRYFYVYSYASGLLVSKFLQKKVQEDPSFIEHVKDFLSAGTSDSPKNLFLNLGIDISKKQFWESSLSEFESLLRDTKLLAKKLGKI